ncbi:MAG: alpha/beta hydrolase family protein [Chloroflexota bacterium]
MVSRSLYRTIALVALAAILVPVFVSCAPAPQPTPSPTPTASGAPTQAITPAPGRAPASLDGEWEGSIKVAGQEIGIVVRFQSGGGGLKGWLDVPAQSAKDNVLNNVKAEGTSIHFEAFGGPRNALFDGELGSDGAISGKFQQASYEGTFTLKLKAPAQPTPTAVVPYKQEEVTFKNGDVTLGGTLSVPHVGGPFPAVVLISGSGQQNRDEEVFGFKPFALIADHFTRNSIAVLRYDDRGIGASTGDTANATSADLAGDVLAAVELLKSRADINPKQIGLLGHSEGGMIAPMVANSSSDVAFIILLAGPGVRGDLLLERQNVDVLKASGASQAEIDANAALQKRAIEVMRTGSGQAELEAELRTQIRKHIEAMPEDQRKALGDIDRAVEDGVRNQMEALLSPWLKFFVTYDPAPALEKVQVPVLAIFGGKDMQVAAEPNEQAMRAALERGQNARATFKTYPNANHLFQPANTGSPNEYATLKEFVPGFLDDTVEWIRDMLEGTE